MSLRENVALVKVCVLLHATPTTEIVISSNIIDFARVVGRLE